MSFRNKEMPLDNRKKKLVIGAAKPWEVKKLLLVLDGMKARYDIFTVDQYKDSFDHPTTYTFGIRSPYNLFKVITAIKTFYKKYDEVIIVNIFPYNLTYRIIVMSSSLFSRGNTFLWFRGRIQKESPVKQICYLTLSPANIILIPFSAIIPFITLIYHRLRNV